MATNKLVGWDRTEQVFEGGDARKVARAYLSGWMEKGDSVSFRVTTFRRDDGGELTMLHACVCTQGEPTDAQCIVRELFAFESDEWAVNLATGEAHRVQAVRQRGAVLVTVNGRWTAKDCALFVGPMRVNQTL